MMEMEARVLGKVAMVARVLERGGVTHLCHRLCKRGGILT
jgi:hypothetical protein